MILISVLFYCYIICILAFVFGFNNVKEFKSKTTKEKTAFSVIIPFRNEAQNLPSLLESTSQLTYSKELIEFIFVDDASTDNSVEIIENFADYTPECILVVKNAGGKIAGRIVFESKRRSGKCGHHLHQYSFAFWGCFGLY